MDERSVFELTPVMPRVSDQFFTRARLWLMAGLLLVILVVTLVTG